MKDALLDAIVAAPDDDAPRLVWADREGGERGELVVVQCALARHDVPRGEQVRLRARERELLHTNAERWSGLREVLGQTWYGGLFTRGFVERVSIELETLAERAGELFERAPLVRSIELRNDSTAKTGYGGTYDPYWELVAERHTRAYAAFPAGRVTSLTATPVVYGGDFGDGIDVPPCSFADEFVALIGATRAFARLESLTLRDDATLDPSKLGPLARLAELHTLISGGTPALVAALRAMPSLARIRVPRHGLDLEALLAAPELARVTALHFDQLDDSELARVVASPAVGNVGRFEVKRGSPAYQVRPLARSPHLRKLVALDVPLDDRGLAELAAAPIAPELRELAAREITAASIDTLLAAFPALERVHLGDTRYPRSRKIEEHLDAIRAVVPVVVS